MKKIKSLLISIFVSGLLFASSAVVFGQQAVEQSYEVSLQLLIGSNDAAQKGNFPSNLSTVSQRLKSGYAYSNYRLAETLLGRISNRGKFDYRSGANIGREIVSQPQNFLEMTVNDLTQNSDADAKEPVSVS